MTKTNLELNSKNNDQNVTFQKKLRLFYMLQLKKHSDYVACGKSNEKVLGPQFGVTGIILKE